MLQTIKLEADMEEVRGNATGAISSPLCKINPRHLLRRLG